MKIFTLLLLSLTPLFSGCGNLQNQHETVTEIIDNGKVVERRTVKDRTQGKAVLMKAAIQNMNVSTTDVDYKHTMKANGVEASGDVEMVKAISAGFKEAFEAGASAAAKAVVPIP